MLNVNEYLENALKEIDLTDLVREEIREMVRGDVQRQIKEAVKKQVDEIIETEIEIALSAPVHTDDGWGNKGDYPDFEALFKDVFRKKLNATWDMKGVIQKQVEAKVKKLFQDNFKVAIDKIVATMLEMGKK